MHRAFRPINVLAMAAVGAAAAACHPVVEPIHGAGGNHSATTTTGAGGSLSTASSTGTNGGTQVWKGYLENGKFDDGTDNVQITVSGDPPIAKVILGAHPLYPPPTDPDVSSPPAERDGAPFLTPTGLTGFEFTGIGTTVTPTRITLSISSVEQWAAWCALETPIEDSMSPGSYSCIPNHGIEWGPPNSCAVNTEVMPTPIDCGKLALCMSVCNCSATACSVIIPAEGDIHFDIAINGTHADGSMVGGQEGGTVHLDLQ